MKKHILVLALAACGLAASTTARAEDKADAPLPPAPAPAIAPAEKTPIIAGLEQLVSGIVAKLKATPGAAAASQFAAEFAQFDALLAKYPEAKAEERAAVLWTKAQILLMAFEDYGQAAAIVQRFKTEFPTTEFATKADEILAAIDGDRKTAELRKSLVEGATFPGIEGKGLDGAAVSTAALKGKVVLIDFWATWCPPCREEIPNVLAAYEKFHAKGFEVVAVSLDREEAELKKFIEAKKMRWSQIFEGADAIAEKFGVESIPTTYLVDADGKIAATNLRGDDLAKKLEQLLGGK